MGLVALRHVGSSQTRARIRVPCIGRRILNHCTTREAPLYLTYPHGCLLSISNFTPSKPDFWSSTPPTKYAAFLDLFISENGNAISPDAQAKKKFLLNIPIFLIPDTQSVCKSHWVYLQNLEFDHFSPLSLPPHPNLNHSHIYLEYYNELLTHRLHFIPCILLSVLNMKS